MVRTPHKEDIVRAGHHQGVCLLVKGSHKRPRYTEDKFCTKCDRAFEKKYVGINCPCCSNPLREKGHNNEVRKKRRGY